MELTDRQFRFRLVLVGLLVLGILALLLLRLALTRDVTRQLAMIHTAGLPTNADEADKFYPAVPDDENAALKMAASFALLTNYPDQRSNEVAAIKFPIRTAALMADDLKLLAGYCALNSNALAQARAAIQLPRCRYPVDLALGLDALLPHLAKLKAIARVAQFQTLLDTNAVASSVFTMIGIARTLDQEPVLISKLVRLAILNMAVAALERRLNPTALSDQDMELLGRLLAEAAKTNQIADALAGERAMYFPLFRMNLDQMSRLANTSGDDNPASSAPSFSDSLSQFFKATGFFERDLRFYLHSMETNISLAATFPKNVPHIADVEEQISRTSKHNYYILSAMLLPALETAIIKEASGLALVRAAMTALAVERFRLQHGTLPTKLDELVPQFLSAVPSDPFDGKPLRYRRLEKGYVVYSIGSDGEDNGGRERLATVKSTDKTPYDIAFTIER